MIITRSDFIGAFSDKPIAAQFFYRTTCQWCGKEIYQAAYRDKRVQQFWFHEDNESEFCDRDTIVKCEPVYGPVNLELYWS